MISSLPKFHFDKNDGLPVWVYDFVEYTLLPRPIVSTAAKRITEVYIYIYPTFDPKYVEPQ